VLDESKSLAEHQEEMRDRMRDRTKNPPMPANRKMADKLGAADEVIQELANRKLSPNQLALKQKLRALRLYAGATLQEMGNHWGLPPKHSPITIMRWERARYPHLPGIDRLHLIQHDLTKMERNEPIILRNRDLHKVQKGVGEVLIVG